MRSVQQPAAKPGSVLEDALSVMSELEKVLADEIALLAKHDMTGLKEITPRKNKLVIDYQSRLKSLVAHGDMLAKATPAMRDKLKTRGIKLAEVTERNALALRTAAQCSQRLINHIIRQVKEEALPKQGYDDPRKANLNLGAYSPTCQPLAVSRTA